MWTCVKCTESNEDTFEDCWQCGAKPDGTPPEQPEDYVAGKAEVNEYAPDKSETNKYAFGMDQVRTVVDQTRTTSYSSSYETARALAKLTAFFGWLGVVVGAIGFFVSLPAPDPISFLISIGLVSLGLISVAAGQVMRAVVDTSDNTGQILALLQNSLVNSSDLRNSD